MEKPVINFQKYEIKEYFFKRKEIDDAQSEHPEPDFELSVTPGVTPDFSDGKISVNVNFENEDISVKLIVEGFFELNKEVSKEKLEEYLVVNGTAIVFPYIRSMISMLTSLDSEKAILLPTINTNNLLDNK